MTIRTKRLLGLSAASLLALPTAAWAVIAYQPGGKRLWRACTSSPQAGEGAVLALEEIGAGNDAVAKTWSPLEGEVEPEAVLALIPDAAGAAHLIWQGRAAGEAPELFSSMVSAGGVTEQSLGIGALAEGAAASVSVEIWPLGVCGLEGTGVRLHVVSENAAGEVFYRAVELEPGLAPWVSPAVALAAIEPPKQGAHWRADGASIAAGEVEASAVVALRSDDGQQLGVFAVELEELGDKRRGWIDGYGACGSAGSGGEDEEEGELPELEGNGLLVTVPWAETVSLPPQVSLPVILRVAPAGAGILLIWSADGAVSWSTRELGGPWGVPRRLAFEEAARAAGFARALASRFTGEVEGEVELAEAPGLCGPPSPKEE